LTLFKNIAYLYKRKHMGCEKEEDKGKHDKIIEIFQKLKESKSLKRCLTSSSGKLKVVANQLELELASIFTD
jgi:hypothetical protein